MKVCTKWCLFKEEQRRKIQKYFSAESFLNKEIL